MSITAANATGVQRRRAIAKTIRLCDKQRGKFVVHDLASFAAARPPKRTTSALPTPALGRKVSDQYTVAVCRLHHRELRRYGDEVSWWAG
jgi:hypothetical protein